MRTTIKNHNRLITSEINNELYALGYRYLVEGNFRTAGGTDPWSGMPNVDCDITLFDDLAEAEAYAQTQHWIFNTKTTSTVYTLSPHKETDDEYRVRVAKEAAERKAQEEAKTKAKLMP